MKKEHGLAQKAIRKAPQGLPEGTRRLGGGHSRRHGHAAARSERNDLQYASVLACKRRGNAFWRIDSSCVPVHYPGTGDIFACVLTGSLLAGESVAVSLDKAEQFCTLLACTTFGQGGRGAGALVGRATSRPPSAPFPAPSKPSSPDAFRMLCPLCARMSRRSCRKASGTFLSRWKRIIQPEQCFLRQGRCRGRREGSGGWRGKARRNARTSLPGFAQKGLNSGRLVHTDSRGGFRDCPALEHKRPRADFPSLRHVLQASAGMREHVAGISVVRIDGKHPFGIADCFPALVQPQNRGLRNGE